MNPMMQTSSYAGAQAAAQANTQMKPSQAQVVAQLASLSHVQDQGGFANPDVANMIPSPQAVSAERERLNYRKEFRRTFRTTIYGLIVVAAVAVLLVTLFFPILRVTGTSMEPTLAQNDIVILMKTDNFKTGDLCGFYFQNHLLIKRIIAGPGDYVDIDEAGVVYVNGEAIAEPYLTERALGETDIKLPFQVPENRYFVMGDHRATSVDSRSSAIGTIESEQILGRIVLRVWPLEDLSLIS